MKLELTANQAYVLDYVLNQVADCLQQDDEGEYYDDGGFLCHLDKKQMKSLQCILKKI